ncbi:MAG: hypothetical protein ABI426_06270, partial [Flavobacterium sp.]
LRCKDNILEFIKEFRIQFLEKTSQIIKNKSKKRKIKLQSECCLQIIFCIHLLPIHIALLLIISDVRVPNTE